MTALVLMTLFSIMPVSFIHVGTCTRSSFFHRSVDLCPRQFLSSPVGRRLGVSGLQGTVVFMNILNCVFDECLCLGRCLKLELLSGSVWAAALFPKGLVPFYNPTWSHRPFFKLRLFILLYRNLYSLNRFLAEKHPLF